MKSYTDIEQSKQLAEILPIESADMRYGYIAPYEYSDRMYDGGYDEVPYPKDFLIKSPNFSANEYDGELPCWSLAALLSVYPMVVGRDMDMYCCWQNSKNLHSRHYDNPIDAVFEMIVKLHESKLL